MKTDIPYLKLVHDTRGGPTDRELEIKQWEIEEDVRVNIEVDTGFVSHLWRKVEREKPNQIAALALIGVDKILRKNIPHNINTWMIPALIRKDYQNENGNVPFFGKITGYYLHQRPGLSFEFDTEGTQLAVHLNSPPHYGEKAAIEFE
jgi:hypothetical protein